MIHAKHSDVSGNWCLLKDGSAVKNLASMQETWVQSLGREGPLEKAMATHSTISAWRIPQTEEPAGLQSMGSQKVGHDWATTTFRFSRLGSRKSGATHILLKATSPRTRHISSQSLESNDWDSSPHSPYLPINSIRERKERHHNSRPQSVKYIDGCKGTA